jgi:hypothetical protein
MLSFRRSWLVTGFVTRVTRRCDMWISNCVLFRSTWLHLCFLWGSCWLNFSFLCNVLSIIVVLFALAIVSSVLWFTASDYPFDIFKQASKLYTSKTMIYIFTIFRLYSSVIMTYEEHFWQCIDIKMGDVSTYFQYHSYKYVFLIRIGSFRVPLNVYFEKCSWKIIIVPLKVTSEMEADTQKN